MDAKAAARCFERGKVLKLRIQAMLFALREIGITGWLGLALMAGAMLYAAIDVPRQRLELDNVRDEISKLQQRGLAARTLPLVPQSKNTLSPFPHELPAANTAPDALLGLDTIARTNKLQLSRYTYSYLERAAPERSGKPAGKDTDDAVNKAPVVEVRIAVPVNGEYRSIRTFIAQALEKRPTLVLDGMSLSRESIGQGNVQGQLRFTLFVRRNG